MFARPPETSKSIEISTMATSKLKRPINNVARGRPLHNRAGDPPTKQRFES